MENCTFMAIFCPKIRFLRNFRISHPSMFFPVLLKACFACAAPAIISKLYSNRLHPMTDIHDGVIFPVIFEFIRQMRNGITKELINAKVSDNVQARMQQVQIQKQSGFLSGSWQLTDRQRPTRLRPTYHNWLAKISFETYMEYSIHLILI